ncbi:hypothetical protein D5086_024683 [Populus alba]|uniref:Uncharacterized protein n=1 Tax=Populus alba TaxID=43335 RepID=A0ACC4B670_POPAL
MVGLSLEVQHRDIRPNQTTVVCALSACGHTGMLHVGKWIHGYVYRNMRSSDSFVLNALVDMYGKCGCLKEAKKLGKWDDVRRVRKMLKELNVPKTPAQAAEVLQTLTENRFEGVKRDGQFNQRDNLDSLGYYNGLDRSLGSIQIYVALQCPNKRVMVMKAYGKVVINEEVSDKEKMLLVKDVR